ncbi:MAG TPA: YciI family protein [Bacteroidia bacterium]|jgi:uncharacterized protein YciI|nr:YciI family protein [Bacteroidia bacterium]HRG51987.1 YciI family protein [Bacteroidia bacterium]
MKRLLFICLLCITSVVVAQENPSEKKYEMKTYYLVFLKKGPNQNQDTAALKKLQEGHMAHLSKMANAGKMDLAGPIAKKDSELRGICVYNVATKEEAEKLVNEDPMVKSGRLVAEILPWYSAKGASLK